MTTVSKVFRICTPATFDDNTSKVISGGAIRGMKVTVEAKKGTVAANLLATLQDMFPTARLVSYDLAVLVYVDPERSEPDYVVRPAGE